jgi:hypothetical protein
VTVFPGFGLFQGGDQVGHQQFVVRRQAGQIQVNASSARE